MVKKSIYVDGNLYEQAKEYLNKRGVSVVRWFEMRLKLLLGGKDETVIKYAAGGAIAFGIIGASFWGYNQYELRKLRCSQFSSWMEAQQAYLKGAKQLDGADRDGISCENLIRASDKEEVEKYRITP